MLSNTDVQIGIMIGTLLTALATAIALIISLRTFRRQLQLNFFADYTKRYQEIVLNFPESINKHDFDFDELHDEKDKTLRYMRAYFDLCSEEYFLYQGGSTLMRKRGRSGKRVSNTYSLKLHFKRDGN